MKTSEATFNKKFLSSLPRTLTKREKQARLEAFKKDLYTTYIYILDQSNATCYRLKPSQTNDLKTILNEAHSEYHACTAGNSPLDHSPFPKTCRLEALLNEAEIVDFNPTIAYHIVNTGW